MSCPYCKYNGTDEAYRNKPIVYSDDAEVLMLYDSALAVWLPQDGCFQVALIIPIRNCPMCGRELE